MESCLYTVNHTDDVETPSLVYYPAIIRENIQKVIAIAGDVNRLCPHVKTYKSQQMIQLMMTYGIHQFKCATIAEAEMVASCGAKRIVLAYPLVGPNAGRLVKLQEMFPQTQFIAIGDDLGQLQKFEAILQEKNLDIPVLIDVAMGGNRTGVSFENLAAFCTQVCQQTKLSVVGFHCYDGNLAIPDQQERKTAVLATADRVWSIRNTLESQGIALPMMIMGGTPSFPYHATYPQAMLSPGTCFINDHGYTSKFKDLDFTPGAVILARVVSRADDATFTIDVGYKAVASDCKGERGRIANLPQARPGEHSEEHWVFYMDEGVAPAVGTILYVVPTHICPTTALYPQILTVENQTWQEPWTVGARNRHLSV